MMISMIIMIGNSVYSVMLMDDLFVVIMMFMIFIYFFYYL